MEFFWLKNLVGGKMCLPLHSQTALKSSLFPTRCGSSAWLEYMPVTHGVAGSSPVRTAEERGEQ